MTGPRRLRDQHPEIHSVASLEQAARALGLPSAGRDSHGTDLHLREESQA